MPSANGVYSLPPGYLAVTGTTILASQHNPPLEDIAAALTLRLSRDGTAPMIGAIQAIAGTAALPGYTFSTDNSTGLSKTTNGVGVSVGGTQVAEFTAAGMASGVRMLGELVPWVQSACPALFVFPVGQTLSRTTYATLWAVAQTEIAAGSVFFNNGDGSTTFGIGDARGCVFACKDNMGGTAAGRLTTGGSGVNGSVLGTRGGGETQTLTLAQSPTGIQSSVSVVSPNSTFLTAPVTGFGLGQFSANAGSQVWQAFSPGAVLTQVTNITSTGNSLSDNTGGGAHPNVQPTLVLNCIMFAGA